MPTRRKRHVLILDDDRIQGRLLQLRLEQSDSQMRVQTLEDADLLAGVLATRTWDAVVMDYHLNAGRCAPDVLRQHADALAEAALIVTSASEAQHVVIEALRHGAIDFLPKQEIARPGVLADIIRRATAKRRLQRAERRRAERRCRHLLRVCETDALTGLANRAHYQRLVAEGKFRNERRRVVCLMIDIDHFKRVNDRWGHDAGDEALRVVARMIRSQSPAGATVLRWGGEEFAVVLAEADPAAAFEWAETLRAAVAETDIAWNGRTFRVTLSIGLTRPRRCDADAPPLTRADTLLYTAKRTGRNRIATESHRRLFRALRRTCRQMRSEPDVRQRRRCVISLLDAPARPVQAEHIGRHCDCVAEKAMGIGRRLGLSFEQIDAIGCAAEFHDLGKAAVPESILAFPGRLNAAQWGWVSHHATWSAWAAGVLGANAVVAWLIRHHHDRFDQSIPPARLMPEAYDGWTGAELHRAAGVLCLADAVVTMQSDRPYAKALPQRIIESEVARLAGRQFAPDTAAAYLQDTGDLVRPFQTSVVGGSSFSFIRHAA